MAPDLEMRRQEIRRFVDLATWASALPPSNGPSRLVGIDGPGGAGKSRLRRGVQRDGEELRKFWNEWRAEYVLYADGGPAADLVGDVASRLRHRDIG